MLLRLEAAGFAVALFLQSCDGNAFFLADRLAAFEGHGALPGFETRVVDEHVGEDESEDDGEGDVDKLDVFHARLDGLRRF
jgi:hypothetical protein